jgi:hypothetical protein
VLGLTDKHSPERLEAASAAALAVGDPTYRTIKGILTAGTDRQDTPARPAGDGGAAAHLRGQAALTLVVEDGLLVDPSTGEVLDHGQAEPRTDDARADERAGDAHDDDEEVAS